MQLPAPSRLTRKQLGRPEIAPIALTVHLA